MRPDLEPGSTRIRYVYEASIKGGGATHVADVNPKRMTVEVDGDFVVFLIGMRINKPWKVHKWLPVFLACR